jgi:hypothetical protein
MKRLIKVWKLEKPLFMFNEDRNLFR